MFGAVACATLPVTVTSQGAAIALLSSGGRPVVRNATPVPFQVLVVVRDEQGRAVRAETVPVMAGESRPLRQDGGRIEGLEPLDQRVPLNDLGANCRAISFASATAFADIRRDAAALQVTRTADARRERDVAAELADVQIENAQDRIYTALNDPYSQQIRRQLARDDPQRLAEIERQERTDALYAQQFATMAANTQITEVYLQQFSREAGLLKPVAAAAVQKRRDLGLDLASAGREFAAGAAHLHAAAREFARAARNDQAATVQPSSVRRLCPGPSASREQIEVVADAAVAGAAIFAKVKFDRGGTLTTVLRRVGATDRWRGMIYWPIAATAARLEVAAPAKSVKWTAVPGRLQTDRTAMDRLVAASNEQLKAVEKMYKTALARSEGRDQMRTMPIR